MLVLHVINASLAFKKTIGSRDKPYSWKGRRGRIGTVGGEPGKASREYSEIMDKADGLHDGAASQVVL